MQHLSAGSCRACCSDKDGRFTLEKVCAMLELGFQRMRLYQPHEFGAQLAGWATLQLHRAMASAQGRESVVDWCAAAVARTCYGLYLLA